MKLFSQCFTGKCIVTVGTFNIYDYMSLQELFLQVFCAKYFKSALIYGIDYILFGTDITPEVEQKFRESFPNVIYISEYKLDDHIQEYSITVTELITLMKEEENVEAVLSIHGERSSEQEQINRYAHRDTLEADEFREAARFKIPTVGVFPKVEERLTVGLSGTEKVFNTKNAENGGVPATEFLNRVARNFETLGYTRPPEPEYLVWWTNSDDAEAAMRTFWSTEEDDKYTVIGSVTPYYITRELAKRVGRNGRGRLWCADDINVNAGAAFDKGGFLANTLAKDYGGIAIHKSDLLYVKDLPGIVTDLDLKQVS